MYAPAPEVPQEEVDWPDTLEPFVSYNFLELVKLRKSAVTGLTNELRRRNENSLCRITASE